MDILKYISDGKTADEISLLVYKSTRTIEGYRQKLLEKTMLEFSERHKDIRQIFERHMNKVSEYVSSDGQGTYLLMMAYRMLLRSVPEREWIGRTAH